MRRCNRTSGSPVGGNSRPSGWPALTPSNSHGDRSPWLVPIPIVMHQNASTALCRCPGSTSQPYWQHWVLTAGRTVEKATDAHTSRNPRSSAPACAAHQYNFLQKWIRAIWYRQPAWMLGSACVLKTEIGERNFTIFQFQPTKRPEKRFITPCFYMEFHIFRGFLWCSRLARERWWKLKITN